MQGFSLSPPRRWQGMVNVAVYIIGFIPAIWYFYLGATNQLGADPVKSFEQALGLWALRFLMLTLAISPLRDILGWNFIRYRRALGLLSFYYVLMHLAAYLLLDLAMDFSTLWDDVAKRPFIMFGMAALGLLVPLALTSNNFSIRKMGRKWIWLHRLIYGVAVLVLLHFSLSAKVLSLDHYFYIALIILMLLYRGRRALKRKLRKLK
ncbi:sulfoxide reductase heme-binding subunit YedZ [Paenochrobactrum gallinarii]|uniref:Protein-methionine-sulfoxide reductase heme-binding subunit MsrQ n=1 Tax=Paenochrobactrum gallinarii TaxID=643673 RepID=A0A841LUP7_9HYPH|nr:protein-methionine-sulfoxide reductase heme-binding subunit MsrQ [Paenochrobactrum gallinarii]MBB6261026.1 sulfoxide reductase heme-binding subunit YedZ [Paenochrobactrum gallinarii]